MERAVRGIGAGAVEAARRARARRHEREADAADLAALGPDRPGPRVAAAGAAPRAAASSRRRAARRAPCRGPCRPRASGGRPPPGRRRSCDRRRSTRFRPADARPQYAISSAADASSTESFALTSAPSTATTGPTMQWSSVTDANGCRTIRLARPVEVRRAVGVARQAGDERAVAEHEVARLGVGGLLDHERRAGEHQPVQLDGRLRIHRELELVGAREQRPRAVRRRSTERRPRSPRGRRAIVAGAA